MRIGEILVQAGILTEEKLEKALQIQKDRGMRLGSVLIQEGLVTEPQFIQALSKQLSIPWVSLWHLDISEQLLDMIPEDIVVENGVLPIYIRARRGGGKSLYVAMDNPAETETLEKISEACGMNVKPMIAGPSEIAGAIFNYYGRHWKGAPAPPREARISSIPPPAARREEPEEIELTEEAEDETEADEDLTPTLELPSPPQEEEPEEQEPQEPEPDGDEGTIVLEEEAPAEEGDREPEPETETEDETREQEAEEEAEAGAEEESPPPEPAPPIESQMAEVASVSASQEASPAGRSEDMFAPKKGFRSRGKKAQRWRPGSINLTFLDGTAISMGKDGEGDDGPKTTEQVIEDIQALDLSSDDGKKAEKAIKGILTLLLRRGMLTDQELEELIDEL